MNSVCPNVLAAGSCQDASCKRNHDVYICSGCTVVSFTEKDHQAHYKDPRHRKLVEGQSQQFYCPICKAIVTGLTVWKSHIGGKPHKAAASKQGLHPDIEPEEPGADVPGHIFCSTCNHYVLQADFDRHSSTRTHARKLQVDTIQAALDEATKDKHGVTILPQKLDSGVVDIAKASAGATLTVTIKTTVPQACVELVEAKLSLKTHSRAPSSPFSIVIQGTNRRLGVEDSIRVTISFKQENLGIYEDRIEFIFEDVNLHQKFVITRPIRLVVASPEYNDFVPKAPYVPKQRVTRDPETDIVPGDPPPAISSIKYVVPLAQAFIPERASFVLKNGRSVASVIRQFKGAILPTPFNELSYARHYKMLVWAEEYRSEADLQIYDLADARLDRHNALYFLAVPGLSENRPSVLVGDSILVQPHGTNVKQGKWFEGRVHVVRREEVGLKFDSSFHQGYNPSRLYRVRFKLNRYPFRRQHQALDTAFAPPRLLFPRVADILLKRYPSARIDVHNPLIANNPAQLQAVGSIVSLPPGSPPFVVFGPPGTGKTVTIVEAIRQVLDRNPNARILACAPSNSAADIIAERLVTLGKQQLFRFYAPSRFKDQVPDALRDFTCTTPAGHFSLPPMPAFKRFRLVVTTCVSASVAYGVGVPRGHFTHIFVDEAGHATEPEAMIGIKTMADNSTNVVLSGDPKQLGPIIRSPVSRELGLEKSYLERIMEGNSHDAKRGYGITVVQLVQNFRSHPAILKFPNERFYHSTLESHGDADIVNSYIKWPTLPNGRFPMIFHAISGKDDREAHSPSFFNILEVLQVKKYVELLRSDRRIRITDGDIGVITPYHAQCLKIRNSLRSFADGVKVGSVEEFQGQERRVIIISTVRSSREFVEYDLKHTLGFVANPRRLNVAVTRAQALVIIVGDPSVLALDPLWRSLLNYIHVNGGWKGESPMWDTGAEVRESGGYDAEAREAALADMNDFARRMEELTLRGLDDNWRDDTAVDRPWRELE